MNDHDLATPAATDDQRIAPRHRCSPAALTRIFQTATGKMTFAWVHNLSASGVAFDLRGPLAVGQNLMCQLKGTQAEECYEVPAEVVHCRLVDGLYRAGCRFFEPFPAERLEAVLKRVLGDVA